MKFKPKEDKVKHGLMIRPKYLILGVRRLGLSSGEKEIERREEEKKKKKKGRREEEENPGMEFMFGTFVWNISFGMESVEPMYGFVG